jgi:solute:Na+ symporter, SSS family
MTHFHWIDITVILGFFLAIFGIAAYYARRAGKDTNQFFLSGRNMPWYIAGTAMVATTFAADTPLAVTELVALNGIAGNWLWWNMALGAMLTVFFFAKLWRRANIMTDVELVELRYSGKAAAVLRGFRALYLGLFMNAIVMGWVNKAMEKIFHVTIPEIDSFLLVVIAAGIIAIYASASGLLGTARTDSFQFVFAMAGCIVLAVIVVGLPEIGSLVILKEKLSPQILDFLPRIGDASVEGITGGALAIPIGAFIAYVGIQWWSSWYPGSDPGGGGYIAQRMMSAKDEKNSLFATLWFTIAHYALRPWPWIIVALAALVLLPRAQNTGIIKAENPAMFEKVEAAYGNKQLMKSGDPIYSSPEFLHYYEMYENTVDPGVMYPKLMVKYLPVGFLGLLIAVFLAAYMSTIASQLNWGTSYIINDFYRRFIVPEADEKHYVLVSRIGIIVMSIFSLLITYYFLTTISGAWIFILNASAGIGAVLILRWYWWRVNAWSEISAMIAPLIIYPISIYVFDMQSPMTLFPIVLGTTVVWITVTYLTKPVEEKKLVEFYKRTYPGGIGWKPIQKLLPEIKDNAKFGRLFVNWFLGVVLVYSFLFGIGKIIFAEYLVGSLLLAVGLSSAAIINFNMRKTEREVTDLALEKISK